jgi:beta-glucosidase
MKPQKNFVRLLHAALKKPAVLVLVNGGVLGIEDYVDDVGAIVEVFRPGAEGGSALAELLVGQANRCKPMQNYRTD